MRSVSKLGRTPRLPSPQDEQSGELDSHGRSSASPEPGARTTDSHPRHQGRSKGRVGSARKVRAPRPLHSTSQRRHSSTTLSPMPELQPILSPTTLDIIGIEGVGPQLNPQTVRAQLAGLTEACRGPEDFLAILRETNAWLSTTLERFGPLALLLHKGGSVQWPSQPPSPYDIALTEVHRATRPVRFGLTSMNRLLLVSDKDYATLTDKPQSGDTTD